MNSAYENTVKYLGRQVKKNYAKSIKQIGNKSFTLTKFIYVSEVMNNTMNYMITDKADGIRTFLILNEDGRSSYINGREMKHVDNNLMGIQPRGKIILDCELIETKNGDKIFYAFDIITFENENISSKSFKERHKYLENVKKQLAPQGSLKIKTYYPLSIKTYQNNIMKLHRDIKVKPYKTDGMIFTNITQNYNRTMNYKWKPIELLTIDFLAIKWKSGKYLLLNGINKRLFKQIGIKFDNYPIPYKDILQRIDKLSFNLEKDNLIEEYFPILFQPSFFRKDVYIYEPSKNESKKLKENKEDLDQKIIEMSFDIKKNKWIFHQIRTDRVDDFLKKTNYGNNFPTAEDIYQSVNNPLLLADLIKSHSELTKDFYFEKSDKSYLAVRKANSFVKKLLIDRYKNSNKLIDLASGKGQDLGNYYINGIKNLLMLEYDINGIDDIIRRKYSLAKEIKVDDEPINISHENQQNQHGTNLSLLQMDLNKSWKDNIKRINEIEIFKKNSVPIIFCNLALHYMIYSKKNAENIINLINYYIGSEGEFIFTAMDGEKVFNLLKENGGKWEVKKNNKTKFMIKCDKKYLNEKFLPPFNVKIKVLLPCDSNEKEETLINIFAIDKIFKVQDILRIETENYSKFLEKFQEEKPYFYNKLSEDDKTFIGLYSYYVYKKK